MAQPNLIVNDVINVLRCGKILDEPELEHESWRYRVVPDRMVVGTAWRK